MNKTTFFKSWLLLLCMIVGSSAAWADEVTFTAGTDTGEKSVTKNDITVSMSTMSRTDNYRTYANTSMTVSAINGKSITKIELTCTGSGTSDYGPGKFSGTGYTYSGTIGTWTGSADEVTLNASSQVRITKIVVTYTSSASNLQASDFALTDVSETLSFDLKDSGSKTIHYSTSSTGNISFNIPDECVETIVDTDAKTITVTPKKETGGEVTITVIQSADNNYLQGSASFKVKIIDSSILLETIVFANLGYQNQDDVVDVNGVYATLKFAQGSNVQNSPTYYTTGSGARMYNGNTLTITATKTIESIEFTFDGSYTTLALASGQPGTLSDAKNSVRTWTGEAKSVVFTTTATNRIKSIKLTYRDDVADTRTETSVEIDATGITNTNVFDGNAAGKLTASVKAADGGPIDDATVTWTSSEEAVATIATDGTVTLVAAGTTTITANYAGVENQYRPSSATYELTVTNSNPNAPGTENNPYTVAQARAAIDAGTGVTGVYATGIVSKIVTAYNSQYGNISYNISDDGTEGSDQLQAYRGKSYNGGNFTSADDIQVGDVVVVYGDLKKYNSTYEFAQDNQLVSLDRPVVTTPIINANNVELEYDATSGEIAYDITNPATGETLSATTTADWISNIAVTDNKVTFTTTPNEGTADRTATITLTYPGAADKEVTVTQKHFVVDYATLPFNWDGGASADFLALNGVSANGLGSDYGDNNSPYFIKLDGTGDYIQVKTDVQPGVVSVGVKMIGGANTSTITVKGSADGTNFTDIEELTISGKQNDVLTLETTQAFGTNDRYVRLVFTKGSNVGVGPISIAKVSTDPVINANDDVELEYDATSGEIAYTITNLNPTVGLTATTTADWISDIDVTTEKVTFTTTANDGDADRTATIKLSYPGATDKEVTVTQKHFVIDYATLPFDWAGGASEDFLALDGVSANGLGKDYAANNAPYNIKFDTTNDYIQIKTDGQILNVTAEVKMLGGSDPSIITVQSSSDGTTFTDVQELGISGALNAVLSLETTQPFDANDRYVRLVFTKGSNVGVGAITINCVRKSISEAGYATYCSPYALDFSGFGEKELKAYEATINGNEVTFSEGDKLFAAGEGMLLKGTAEGTYTIPVIATATKNENNKLIGVLEETEITETGIFVLLNGGNGTGFYKTKSAFTVGAHTAYLPAQAGGNGAREFIAIDDNTTTGVNSIDNGQLTIDNVYNLNGQRVNNAKKGLYIVNGKKVVIK